MSVQGNPVPVRMFRGHKKRAFNVSWSPLIPNVLASGSDDRNIHIWDVTSGSCKVGIRSRVTPLRTLSRSEQSCCLF